jgi:hypothetical protein
MVRHLLVKVMACPITISELVPVSPIRISIWFLPPEGLMVKRVHYFTEAEMLEGTEF